MMRAAEVRNLTFKYKGQSAPVFSSVSFDLAAGQIVGLTGPSGCGKSTLGYCLCGVIPRLIKGDLSGQVNLSGRAGIVFQDPDAQFFLTTVEDELAFAPENLCLPREEIEARITGTLESLGISDLRHERPSRLSGGQKQLVALGGVLTMAPDVIILDETMSQLDDAARDRVKQVLLGLKRENKTVIMIEHDRDSMSIADQIWLLDQGKLECRSVSSEVNTHG